MILDVKSKTLVLLQGLPGCGKSTFVKKWGLESFTLCKDEFRIKAAGVKSGEISQDSNGVVKRIVYMILEERLKNGLFTVMDETNVFNTTVEKYKEYAQKYGFNVVIIRFYVSIDECYKRQQNRGFRAVPKEVIDKLNSFLVHMKHESVDSESVIFVESEEDA